MKIHRLYPAVAVLLIVAALAVACGPTPEPEKVVETVVVQETVVVEGTPQVVEKVVTATPEAVTSESEATEEEFYFVYVPKLVHPWYEDLKMGIEDAIAEVEEAGIKVKFEWDAPPHGDVVIHTQRLEAATAKEPDVLFASCLDPAADTPLLDQAAELGIPVMTFDNDCPDANRLGFIGHPTNEPDGRGMAEALAQKLDYEGEVAVLIGSPGSVQHGQRVAGFKEVIAKYPDMEVVAEEADNDDLERAVNLTASLLNAHPNLKGIYGANATAPIGAARAIVEAGKQGEVFVVGQDDLPEMVEFLRDGVVVSMSLQRPYEMGYWSIYHGIAAARGHTVPPLHETGSWAVGQDMVDSYKKQ